MSPKISVIVPIYKVEKYIRQCLDSLANQTLKDIEIIMINDGTPDNSAKIAQEYSIKYENFKLIHKENEGVAEARNEGLRHVNGKYVTFLDSDDSFSLKACEVLYQKAKQENSDIVIGKPVWLNKNGTIKPVDYAEYWFNGKSDKNYRSNNKIVVGIPIATSKLYKKELIKKNNIVFPNLIGEDLVFWLHAWYYAKKINIVPDIVYLRTKRDDSITQHFVKKVVEDRLKVLKILDEYCEMNKLYEVKDYMKHNLSLILSIISYMKEESEKIHSLIEMKKYIDQSFDNKNKVNKYIEVSYKELEMVTKGNLPLEYLFLKHKYKKKLRLVARKIYRKFIKY